MKTICRSLFVAIALAAAVPALAVVPSTASRVDLVADGDGKTFAFTFKTLDKAHVEVFVDGVKQTSGFTVVLAANQVASPGGTVTFTTAPAAQALVRIQRTVPLTQGMSLPVGGAFPSKTVERAHDLSVMGLQQVAREVAGIPALEAKDIVHESRMASIEATHAADKATQSTRDAGQDALIAGKRNTTDQAAKDGQQDALIEDTRNAQSYQGVGDATSVLATGSAIARPLKDRFADVVNLRDQVDPTGATDVAGALQLLLAAVPEGSTIDLAGGTYQLGTGISAGKRLHFRGPGSFVESAILSPMLAFTADADGSTVRGITFAGSETLAGFPGDTTALNRAAIVATSADDMVVEDVKVTNKSVAVRFTDCNRATVARSDLVGFIDQVTAGANNSPAFFIQGGTGNRVLFVRARNCGSVVLVGSDAQRPAIVGVEGSGLYDNGIYISSGVGASVVAATIADVFSIGGSGIKARGSRHTVTANTVSNVPSGSGITLSGNGLVPDADGANGFGTVAALNTIENVGRYGLDVDDQDELNPRDFVLSTNTLRSVALEGSTYAGVKVQGHGHAVDKTTIDGYAGQFGVIASSSAGAEFRRLLFTDNTVRGAMHATPEGFRLNYVADTKVRGNKVDATTVPTNAYRLRNTTDLELDDNQGSVFNWDSSFPSTGGVCRRNSATSISGDLSSVAVGGTTGGHASDVLGIAAKQIVGGTAVPTTGTWARGDVVLNTSPSNGAPSGWICVTAGSPGTWRALSYAVTRGYVLTPYVATPQLNQATGDEQVMEVTNETAFTFGAPTAPFTGSDFTIRIKNISAASLSATNPFPPENGWRAAAWVQPAPGYSRSITFRYDGTNWIEISRTPADVPN